MHRLNDRKPIDAENTDRDEQRGEEAIGHALRWSSGVMVVAAVVAATLVFWFTRPVPEATDTEVVVELPEIRARPKAVPPTAVFTDITVDSGIGFIHENGARGEKLLPETMGGGCAFLDFDRDGDQDILFVNSCHWPWDDESDRPEPTMCLYRNDGTGRFDDVTKEAGLKVAFYGMGVAVGDYDNDGDPDLFVSSVGPNHLYRNDAGLFVEVTQEAGVAGAAGDWGTSCAWIDYNKDGRLDLFVGNYVRWSKAMDLAQDFRLVGVGRAYGPPISFEGAFPYLYRNDGEGRFTDVSAEAGIQITNPDTQMPQAKTLGLAPVDADDDGWIDLVVANDTVQNFLLHNQRNGTFREIGALAGIAFDSGGNARGAMGVDAAHFRNNQTLGVAIGNFANEMTALYVAQDEPMQFVDATIATGLGPRTRLQLTFGLFFFDYDLDGRLDLLAANGHLEKEINRVQTSQYYEQPPQLFWNGGPNKAAEFVPVSVQQCGSDLHQPMVGRGAAFGDIDNDGDLDVLLTAVGGRPRLLRNDQQLGHRWLRFRLEGRHGNRDAIGAWVEIHSGGQVQRRQVMPTRGYLSQSELPVTFGLGKAGEVERVTIRWPDGRKQEITDYQIGRVNEVVQPGGP
ncbi:MAG: CRTAC1 family protein, partial [Pirellulaceae bacterium]